MSQRPQRVVIIGAGFAGLNAVKSLKPGRFEITLIDRTNHHLFQPLLYQVATGSLSFSRIATPIREVLAERKDVAIWMAEVIKIDKQQQTVFCENGRSSVYDHLIVATGARHSYFGKPEWEKFAPGLKTLNDAAHLRDRILRSFELAEQCTDAEIAQSYLNFVIIGGGPTGVELSGSISEICRHNFLRYFHNVSHKKVNIYLVEASPQILNAFPASLSLQARHDLSRIGVKVLTGTAVTEVTAEGVRVGTQWIASHCVVWAAGNEASKLLVTLDTPLDRQGRAIVNPDLSIPQHDNVFVIGDAAHCKGKKEIPLPAVAPTAIQQGIYVARILNKQLSKTERSPFKYFDKGSMATIGKGRAIAAVGRIYLSGFIAWLAWGFIHIVYLINFRNRFSVIAEWSWLFLTNRRGSCLLDAHQGEVTPAEAADKSPPVVS